MNESKLTTYRMKDDPVIRFCASYLLLYVGSLILGGVGIFLITFGIMFFFTRVLARTPIGQKYIRRFFDFKQPDEIVSENHSRIYKIVTTSIRLILFGFYAYGSAALIWLGIKFLLEDGFLNQNLIYILLFKFK